MSQPVYPRLRWMYRRIAGAFDGVEVKDVEDAVRKSQKDYQVLVSVFEPEARAVFVYWQPATAVDEKDGEVTFPNGDAPQLVFTNGEDVPLRSKKAVYFIRGDVDTAEKVDVDVASDKQVLFGEVSEYPLANLSELLSKMYNPRFTAMSNGEWKKADGNKQKEFLAQSEKVAVELRDQLKGLTNAVELRKPDKRFDEASRNFSQRAKDGEDPFVKHCNELLEEWCKTIEGFLGEKSTEAGESDQGPMTELDYWRRRQQKLNNILEQLKTKECKTVISNLSSLTKTAGDVETRAIFTLLRRWKQIDIKITEAANEAKDNVKYLNTLEKFLEPLYNGSPSTIIDTLPALMNSIKMIHTIARYYNTTERMTTLFNKITNEMIANCKASILGSESGDLWKRDPAELVVDLENCLKLNEAYQENYRLTKDKLLTMPKGKQFDFSETQIFGKFDLFCRRVIKLIDMFSTIHQFNALASHKLEGMEGLIADFKDIVEKFQKKGHKLLEYHNNKFDRDFVEFNVSISDLEMKLQNFINESFDNITSIEHSLNLLKKFQAILQRENLKSDLDAKFNVIFKNYGQELNTVQELYEKHKHSPPMPRNLPPVSGNIAWSRHLLKRIEEPMKKFESNHNVLSTKDAKHIIKTYNKVARTLVAFEYLWYQAWQQSIETAKAGLQATLIIRHPDDGRLYVNFDQEIMQLIREAKCLDRMGIEIPEGARIVLLQEDKFKSYYNDLTYALKEYERVNSRILDVTRMLLRPHTIDMEYKLRPGMITLTWTSMNIDAYKHHIHTGLRKFEELINNVNDIIENRIEKNLKHVSKMKLVNMDDDENRLSLDEFVAKQEAYIKGQSSKIVGKNIEVETAVEDLILLITSYQLDAHIPPVDQEAVIRVREHYNHFMYTALLHAIKSSMNLIKKRVTAKRGGGGFLFLDKPFFDVDVQLAIPHVRLSPSLDEIQKAINKAASAVVKMSKQVPDWKDPTIPNEMRPSYFERIGKDIEIVRNVLLLTGSIQGLKSQTTEYLAQFDRFNWLWHDSKEKAYKTFLATNPSLNDYNSELNKFEQVSEDIRTIAPFHTLGALALNTSNLKLQLNAENRQWKEQFTEKLHAQAGDKLRELIDYISVTNRKLTRQAIDVESLRYIMDVLKEIREKESGIEMEIGPVMDMYTLLETHLPQSQDKEEMDQKQVLRSSWKRLVDEAENKTDNLSELQSGFKRELLKDVKEFVVEVLRFRNEFTSEGPMVPKIKPKDAVVVLHQMKEKFDLMWRKYNNFKSGEQLFALPETAYPKLMQTKKEIGLCEQLYGLYSEVIETITNWRTVLWGSVPPQLEDMGKKVESFQARCDKMPRKLRDWPAYIELKKRIDDFVEFFPLVRSLSEPSIKPRHWEQIMKTVKTTFKIESSEFRLETLIDANLVDFKEDIEEVCEGASKQLKIEKKMEEIKETWQVKPFDFMDWKDRGVKILKGVVPVVEELEEAQMQMQTMLTMRHVKPFREEAETMLKRLSDTSDVLEQWSKVQMMWCSLESVFLAGDIAKQMPVQAKKFKKMDKMWTDSVMKKAFELQNVVECCQNETVFTSLSTMYEELERCQKSLDGYLEQKRNKFPRFYFVSNPVLLRILSQGSDPLAVQQYYEKIFDSVDAVVHDKSDKTQILQFYSRKGKETEDIDFCIPVQAKGNIEEWLLDMLRIMQCSMKLWAIKTANAVAVMDNPESELEDFVDQSPGQFALLGIQFLWTTSVQDALSQCKGNKGIMKKTNKDCLTVLSTLSSWCLDDKLSKLKRRKVEALVTIQVHQRDVMNDIFTLFKQKHIHDPNDFEWQKQLRFYWRPEAKDEVCSSKTSRGTLLRKEKGFPEECATGAVVIGVTDVDFNYQYEYLGCKGKLAITPLTDRCFITLAQALGMCFGGAPAGPAGTGKTETVKDMGCALGMYVMVQNCSDQMSYLDCAKIFKGLCMGGLWGCFDEFNRITLPVLSVVAQQVLAIQNAKKQNAENFLFPGNSVPCQLQPVCGFFITMNPGYAGRQELPENLKALFRGVAMMVPDREIIMKVILCAVGYTNFSMLAKKFASLYQLCEEQLSQQKHYDFGLRNILSVLRTMGVTKRKNLDKPETVLVYRTLRDMNLSKMVSQDVPLFLSLLKDLFPNEVSPPTASYEAVEAALKEKVEKFELVQHPPWVTKVIQLYETTLVRHGIMLVGPTGGGKTQITRVLMDALQQSNEFPYKQVKLNPKAIRAAEMYGEVDKMSGEWVTGVFAAMWGKMNKRENKFSTWLVADGPVDAIWIEDLNTVLDDNKILTLANGDRIPMTDQNHIMFEVETLVNASPATVSRVGIIYVSDTDLDWGPVVEAWVAKQDSRHRDPFRQLFKKYFGECCASDPGKLFNWIVRNVEEVMNCSRVGKVAGMYNIIDGLMMDFKNSLSDEDIELEAELERIFLYALAWSVGGLLEAKARVAFDAELRNHVGESEFAMPPSKGDNGSHQTIFEYFVNSDRDWEQVRPPVWVYPDEAEVLDFSSLLVPTMDSTRAGYLFKNMHKQRKPILAVGGPGTAKTSSLLMFFNEHLNPATMLVKRVNFSSATTPKMLQDTIEGELDKRGGKTYGPPNGKKMTVFFDDCSMPEINEWGDQPTMEFARQAVESGGFAFLDKDKRGDLKVCEGLQYVAAMGHPGGGRNDVPDRFKRHFLVFNMVLPAITSINDMYGQMLTGRYPSEDFDAGFIQVVEKVTSATIELWSDVAKKMLPTPAKFHYVFNMRELSRVFQGVLLTPPESLTNFKADTPAKVTNTGAALVALWKHECERVFCDKLTNNKDKDWYLAHVDEVIAKAFPPDSFTPQAPGQVLVHFLRDPVLDEDGFEVAAAAKIYEDGGTLESVRDRVKMFMAKYNEAHPATPQNLVLFDDALAHLLRISRLLNTPRCSALLVGVGGSGKQSLTRLASFIAGNQLLQIVLTKNYNVSSSQPNNLVGDLSNLYRLAGKENKPCTFLFTDQEIKSESFLEVLNSVLMTGEVAGMFSKEDLLGLTADLGNDFAKARPDKNETPDNLRAYFYDRVRDNLHVVLCMSPMNAAFAERARKFPGLINGCTIDWFLPWPQEALVDVSTGFIKDFDMGASCPEDTKDALIEHMGSTHQMVVDGCEEYFGICRRRVYQTPKTYLSFIQNYKTTYKQKLAELEDKESRITLGLDKLDQGGKDVEAMKIVLAEKAIDLAKASKDTEAMLSSLEISSTQAQKKQAQVEGIATQCTADATRIAGEKHDCEADLAKAMPWVHKANTAIASIKPAHITEVKNLKAPSHIIKLVFDGVLLLFNRRMDRVTPAKLIISKKEIQFLEPSFGYSKAMMSQSSFLNDLIKFGDTGKDKINEETIELLLPYIELNHEGNELFMPKIAKSASQAAEGLCTYVRAMKYYHEASKIVKPKLEALSIAEGELAAANAALAAAEGQLKECQALLQGLQAKFEAQMGLKRKMEAEARGLQKKMDMASSLIGGLAGEQERWGNDAKRFASVKRQLVGDCAVACAFMSYLGPFNQEFRKKLLVERFAGSCDEKEVPVTEGLEIIDFCVDQGTMGDWMQEGLPTDPLSLQNGILVTQASRFPLLIDPQGQALNWIRNREEANIPKFGMVPITDEKNMKDFLEFAMGEGKTLVITDVEETLDPMFDPVLEKEIIKKGKNKYINVADQLMEYNESFLLYFITRLPNPHFSPELQAKTTVVDFTVTQLGLEEQLLGKVISVEQRALEVQLADVLREVNDGTKTLLALDAALLNRLTSNTGNLLDDEELVEVLGQTKKSAKEVEEKLKAAEETKKDINEKREQYRPVATRGSVLYFAIVEMSLVNVMYQTSLQQFLGLFMMSMEKSERASLAQVRVENIIETLTYLAYRYVNLGLYEKHKLLFVLIVTMKILVTANTLKSADVKLFLRCGAALNAAEQRKKPHAWMSDEVWMNCIMLKEQVPFFRTLPDEVAQHEATWKVWYESNEPESMSVPDFESQFVNAGELQPWLRLLLIRAMRNDRTVLQTRTFIKETPAMGEKFIEPITDLIETIFESVPSPGQLPNAKEGDAPSPIVPVVYLLSIGADPTDAIETLCRKKKQEVAVVSMGQGQGEVAKRAIASAAHMGSWVLLQNCELGLDLMQTMEQDLLKLAPNCHNDFRLWISAGPHPDFPLGLLQMSTKVTNEPPAGLRAGLMRSYTILVDQDRMERVDTAQWRQLLFTLCFMHSIVQERLKFGPLGWCIPYEYNTSDLTACILFLEKHLYSGTISWPTVQYMVAEAQYGGKITDDMDRILFNTYAAAWINPGVLDPSFSFNPAATLLPLPGDFNYTIPAFEENEQVLDFLKTFPEIDSPELSGLHPNADLTFRVQQAERLLATLGATQPQTASSSGGMSKDEVVTEKCRELLKMVPADYKPDVYKQQIKALGSLSVPLNIFLFQEVECLQAVIAKVRDQLIQLQLAIKGEVVMTNDLLSAMNDIYNAVVPNSWVVTIAGDEFSWFSPTLGLWFQTLTDRDEQLRKWLTGGRPNSFWFTGFSNPNGFLTAMKQEVARQHKADGWALDDVVYHTEVTDFATADQVRAPPKEGVYVHGLFLEGGRWEGKSEGTLAESEPKVLFAPLPVLYITGVTKPMRKDARSSYGPHGPYECPLYKYKKRTGRFYITLLSLSTRENKPSHWTLRGCAALCSIDY